MTRLEQALKWWQNRRADYGVIPDRHFQVLDGAGLLEHVEDFAGCAVFDLKRGIGEPTPPKGDG